MLGYNNTIIPDVMGYHLGGQAIHEEEGGDDPSLARKIAKEHGSKCVGLGT